MPSGTSSAKQQQHPDTPLLYYLPRQAVPLSRLVSLPVDVHLVPLHVTNDRVRYPPCHFYNLLGDVHSNLLRVEVGESHHTTLLAVRRTSDGILNLQKMKH